MDWWESIEDFLALAAGYCVMSDERAVALCFVSFTADDRHWGLGVYTHEDYRQRGFAHRLYYFLLGA